MGIGESVGAGSVGEELDAVGEGVVAVGGGLTATVAEGVAHEVRTSSAHPRSSEADAR